MSTITKENVISFIENMSVLELSQLVKDLEAKFGVSAAAPVAVAAVGGGAAAPAAEAKTEFNVIQHGLQTRLILAVSASNADRQHWLGVFEDQRRSQRDARSLARFDAVGMSFPSVEALQPRAEPEAGLARLHAAPTARCRDDDVAPTIGGRTGRRVVNRAAESFSLFNLGEQRLASSRIARTLIERCVFAVDQRSSQAGVIFRQHPLDGHIHEQRVGLVHVAIGQRQLHRFQRDVNCLRLVVSHRGEIKAFQQSQRLQQVRSLSPHAAFENRVAAVIDRERFLNTSHMRGEVFIANQSAVSLAPRSQFASERASIKIVAGQSQATTPIAAPFRFGFDQSPQRPSEQRMPFDFASVEQPQRRLGHIREPQRAVPIEQRHDRIKRRRHGCRSEFGQLGRRSQGAVPRPGHPCGGRGVRQGGAWPGLALHRLVRTGLTARRP